MRLLFVLIFGEAFENGVIIDVFALCKICNAPAFRIVCLAAKMDLARARFRNNGAPAAAARTKEAVLTIWENTSKIDMLSRGEER